MDRVMASAPAIRIFERLLRGFDAPPVLRLWNDAIHVPNGSPAVFTLVLRDPGLLRRLVIQRNPVMLADAYFRGALDVEGDLYAALLLKGHFAAISLSWRDKLALLRDALRLPGPIRPASSRPVHAHGKLECTGGARRDSLFANSLRNHPAADMYGNTSPDCAGNRDHETSLRGGVACQGQP